MRLFDFKKFFKNREIKSACEWYNIVEYTINDDGSIDVKGDVLISFFKITKLPLKFRKVGGNFKCYDNYLTTLEGCPEEVGGSFDCGTNQLTSLEGCPKLVGGYFDCSDNQLTSLEGCTKKISGDFDCSDNQLTTLRGGPEEVCGDFYKCHDNDLKDVEGFPEFWEGELRISNNPVFNIIKLFTKEKWCKAVYLINEYKAIDGLRVNSYVLEEIFHELGLTPSEIKYIEGYEVI